MVTRRASAMAAVGAPPSAFTLSAATAAALRRPPSSETSGQHRPTQRPSVVSAAATTPAQLVSNGGITSSPRRFIQEAQVTPRLHRSSTLTPVDDSMASSGSSACQDAAPTASAAQGAPPRRPQPMCNPLFGGWCDTSMFSSLVAKDIDRLLRRLTESRGGKGATGRRDLADPTACRRSLVDMLLSQSATAGPLGTIPPRSAEQARDAGGKGCAFKATAAVGSEKLGSWRNVCGEFADRAAHLEVLLALIAETMSVRLAGGSRVADSAGCPPTRIGWIDEFFAATEPTNHSTPAPPVSSLPPPKIETRAIGVATCGALVPMRSGATQTEEIQRYDIATQAVDELIMLRREPILCSVECQTLELPTKPVASEQTVVVSSSSACQTELSTQHAQTNTETVAWRDVGIIARPHGVTTDVQTVDIPNSVATAAVQTDAASSAMPKKTSSHRERRLFPDEIAAQLAAAREKLSLEREASSALEDRLEQMGRVVTDLRHENDSLRATAASATAAAKIAKIRPRTTEHGSQTCVEHDDTEIQTEPLVFYSHSWQKSANNTRDDAHDKIFSSFALSQASPNDEGCNERETGRASSVASPAVVEIWTQTEPARVAAAAATQTVSTPMVDVCVGDDADGGWREQFEGGMQAMAQQWRSRWQASEDERVRLAKQLQDASAVS